MMNGMMLRQRRGLGDLFDDEPPPFPYIATAVPPGWTAAQWQAYLAGQTEDTGVGIKLDSKGIKLGDTVLSWPVIMGGLLVVMLMQSKGFERKR